MIETLNNDVLSEESMIEYQHSLEKFSWVFFPERFTKPFSVLHKQIFSAIDEVYCNTVFNRVPGKIALAAPRGLGKTSIAMSLMLRAILFEHFRFIIYISNSYDSAEEQTENAKGEIVSNKLISAAFGDVRSAAIDDTQDKFSKKSWRAMNTIVVARGSGQQVRGRLYKNSRPDLIIVDDLEDTETIYNEEVRKKRKNWFFSDVMHCFGLSDRNWLVLYIDTIKHQSSLLVDLLNNPSWKSLCIDICDDNLTSLAPDFISTDELKAEYEEHKKEDTLDVFFMERRNIPAPPEARKFSAKMWKYYKESPDLDWNGWEHIVLVDPARRRGLRNANTAIAGISVNVLKRKIRVRELINEQLDPDKQVEESFNMLKRLKGRVMGVEVTGGDEYIEFPFDNYATEHGIFYERISLKSPGGLDNDDSKYRRVMSIYPMYKSGAIEHNSDGCCVSLEAQLLSLPRPRKWDAMDVVSRIVAMMEEGGRYFCQGEVAEKEYELEYQKLMREEKTSWEKDEFEYELAI